MADRVCSTTRAKSNAVYSFKLGTVKTGHGYGIERWWPIVSVE